MKLKNLIPEQQEQEYSIETIYAYINRLKSTDIEIKQNREMADEYAMEEAALETAMLSGNDHGTHTESFIFVDDNFMFTVFADVTCYMGGNYGDASDYEWNVWVTEVKDLETGTVLDLDYTTLTNVDTEAATEHLMDIMNF